MPDDNQAEANADLEDYLASLKNQEFVLDGFYDGTDAGELEQLLSARLAEPTYRVILIVHRRPAWLFAALEKLLRPLGLKHWCYRRWELPSGPGRFTISVQEGEPESEEEARVGWSMSGRR